ncbi:hypothetical protein SLS58_007790 [Diplodia intermedia]|uniref:Bacteriophage T5 Orf172 DNA-binding domain-containing protein n=1 Tax=Diplodia intermedia TaxID=856260 RepID=A0ABR3TJK0_9PEZI
MSKELSTTATSRYTSPSLDSVAEDQATRLPDLGIIPTSPTKPQQQTQEQDQKQDPKPNEGQSATAKASSGSNTKAKEAIIPYEQVRKFELELYKELHHWRFYSRMFRGYVYILTSASRPNLVKIGMATDPDRRVKQLRRECKLPDMKIVHLTRELQWPERLETLG